MRLARARRAVKKQALLHGEAKTLDRLASAHEVRDIAIEKIEGRSRQDDILAGDVAQPVHLDGSATAGRIVIALQRDHPAAIGPSPGGAGFDLAKQILGEAGAAVT